MQDASVQVLSSWENFYVIMGSAAAALTGLMFVVITLIAGSQILREGSAFDAFGTPTVVHFCVALLIAAIISAPWGALWQVCIPLGLSGLGGIVYVVIVIRRLRRSKGYQPVFEDWLWHAILPFLSYLSIVISVLILPISPVWPLFIIGAVTVLLVFIGIHNSWDTITYVAANFSQADKKS